MECYGAALPLLPQAKSKTVCLAISGEESAPAAWAEVALFAGHVWAVCERWWFSVSEGLRVWQVVRFGDSLLVCDQVCDTCGLTDIRIHTDLTCSRTDLSWLSLSLCLALPCLAFTCLIHRAA